MGGQISNRCFVILPAGDAHYARLFDEVLSLAITEANLVPYRVQHTQAAPLPIDLLIREIGKSDALLADLSQSGDEIWCAVGCALALKKPLCLISSKLEFSLPLNVQYLKIIAYPTVPFPGDYRELGQKIKERLLAKRLTVTDIESTQPAPESTPVASESSALPEDLTAHEVLALTIIDVHASAEGLSPRALGLEMQTRGSAHLTSHAMNALKRRRFIERRPVSVTDGAENYISENLFITWSGKNWLLQHGQQANSLRSGSSVHNLVASRR
jgi:hypothetical protein